MLLLGMARHERERERERDYCSIESKGTSVMY
jgi:hypothetical protein